MLRPNFAPVCPNPPNLCVDKYSSLVDHCFTKIYRTEKPIKQRYFDRHMNGTLIDAAFCYIHCNIANQLVKFFGAFHLKQ